MSKKTESSAQASQKWVKKIVIVGGGTAGWMAASILAKMIKSVDIVLVESEEIGVVGVGEATIPAIKIFNDILGLNEAEFMRETKATFKLGIEFKDWGAKGEAYFHPFGTYGLAPKIGYLIQHLTKLNQAGEGGDIADFSICAQAAKLGKMQQTSNDPQNPLTHFSSAYHFDAILYGKYLRKFAQNLGVKRFEGLITKVNQDAHSGFVTSVMLKSGEVIEGDLFVDCSGLKGLLIEETLKTGYEDWSHYLPMNRAVAVPCERQGELTPYTTSTARDAGWQWRIPLQHRIGNGYVYSSQFIEDDLAKDVLMKNLEGEALAEPRLIKFTTGRRKKLWVKNVLALGLAGGFLEPLESTSIHLVHASLFKFIAHFPDMGFSQTNIDAFNRRIDVEIEEIRDFLILHYHATKRDDTPLWHYVRTMPIPEALNQRIELFKDRGQLILHSEELFTEASWVAVLMGQGQVPQNYTSFIADHQNEKIKQSLMGLKGRIDTLIAPMPSHADFLKSHNMLS